MAKFKRIVLHWTAGGYYPNKVEKDHYHYLIDKDGKVYEGNHKCEDNLNVAVEIQELLVLLCVVCLVINL